MATKPKTKVKESVLEVTIAEEMLPLEEVITKELAKHSITEAILSEMEANFLPLTINGLEDKEGYAAVDSARKAVKNLRVLGVKICKDNRAEAIKFQKKWIEAEDKFEARTKAIEAALEEKQAVIDNEKERIKQERELKEQAILHERAAELLKFGMKLEDGAYVLDDIKISVTSAKNYDSFSWTTLIAGVEKKWQEKEAIRIENERLAEEAATNAKRIAEENLQKQEELRKKEEALAEQQHKFDEEQARQKKAAEDLIIAQQNAEKLRIETEQAAVRKAKEEILKSRMSSLFAIGFSQQANILSFKEAAISLEDISQRSDKEFELTLIGLTEQVTAIKKRLEQERLEEQEKIKQDAINKERARIEAENKAKIEAEEADRLKKEKEAADKLAEEQRLAALAPDEQKLTDFLKATADIAIPVFTSEAYMKYWDSIVEVRKSFLAHVYHNRPSK